MRGKDDPATGVERSHRTIALDNRQSPRVCTSSHTHTRAGGGGSSFPTWKGHFLLNRWTTGRPAGPAFWTLRGPITGVAETQSSPHRRVHRSRGRRVENPANRAASIRMNFQPLRFRDVTLQREIDTAETRRSELYIFYLGETELVPKTIAHFNARLPLLISLKV